MNFSGEHKFSKLEDGGNCTGCYTTYLIYKCNLCELKIRIVNDYAGVFMKGEKTCEPGSLETLNNLPSCNELIIKNLLE